MLRRFIQATSSRAIAHRFGPRGLNPASLAWRCFSDDGGGKDGEDGNDQQSREDDIYTSLFGSGNDEGDLGGFSDGGSQGLGWNRDSASSFGRFGSQEGGEEDDILKPEDDESTDEMDIPVPLFSDSFDVKEEDLYTKLTFDDIPDWTTDVVSRISKERVQLLEDGIPSLSALSSIPLPPPPPPHPGHGLTKEYALIRREAHRAYVSEEVAKLAEPKVARILALPTWQEKQDAVDELFETIEFQLRGAEPILQGHPKFGSWVEEGLEAYLKTVAQKGLPESSPEEETSVVGEEEDPVVLEASDEPSSKDEVEKPYPSEEEDNHALPVFMDCYNSDDGPDQLVPSILAPLKPHHNMGTGRMVEEWELSAHKTSKRILLRQSTREIARALQESDVARVFVTGKGGVGKSAALATIVASARKSGYIVLYMPDGNRLHKLGYYIEPNQKIEGMFDLPVLSQEVCSELLSVHESDLEGMKVEQDVMEYHFTEEQLADMTEYSGGSISLVELLKLAALNEEHAPMCFTITIDHLMKQDEKPFLMVMDQFNCYFEPGHYFHMDYDLDVRSSIPYAQINLFKPALDAMALSLEDDDEIPLKKPISPKRGGVVVGISENCAVARKVTDALCAYAHRSASGEKSAPLTVVDVPRFSALEVDHVVANFECTGIGHLRCDQGETVMNTEGIDYLRMVSSNTGQNLLDVCCT